MSQKKELRSIRDKVKYSHQRVRTTANKLKACRRHVKDHPNDSFGAAQLKKRLSIV